VPSWPLRLALAIALLMAPLPSAADSPPNEETLREAKELFRQGNVMREAGDFERALDFYRRSRALVESVPNTLNAALCLSRLGRYDEALELYEELLTRLGRELTEADRKTVLSAIENLRKRLGRLDVSANVEGALVIDGRPRGRLPLHAPVPVLPGARHVRILKDGYATFETSVTIRAGEARAIDAALAPLALWGKLRVDAANLAGADLYVDGGLVGKLPWEGTLTPGAHLYRVQKGEIGSAPARAIVVQGQTVLVGVDARPLGPEIEIAVEPATAELILGAVPVGPGGFRGRLPIGSYRAEAREIGYHAAASTVNVTTESAGRVVMRLRVDADHPRWGSARKQGRFWMDAWAGPAIAATVAPGAADACDDGACSSHPIAVGAMVGLRGGYQLPIGLSVELGLGMLAMHESVTRTLDAQFGRPSTSVASFRYTDEVHMAGPFVSAGVGYRRDVWRNVGLGGRLHLGLAFPRTRDWVSASASSGGRTVPAEVEGSGAAVTSAAFFVMPEIEARLRFGRAHIGVGVGAALFVLDGPDNPTGETRVRGGVCRADATVPPPVECAPGVRHAAGENAYGPFAMFVPSFGAGYVF
jgi:hypothetical protein